MAVGALAYQGGVTVYQSAPLELKNFVVKGNSGVRVSDEQIILASGVDPGTRLLKVSIDRVEANVSLIPWISEVQVDRLLPSTLQIRVSERRARMQVVTESGPFLVDGQGKVLQRGSENMVEFLDLPVGALAPGDTLKGVEFRQAAAIFNSLPRRLRGTIGSVRAPTIDRITLQVEAGPTIFYGAAEQLEEKNFALESLMLNKGANVPGATIDVRVPSRPSVKLFPTN